MAWSDSQRATMQASMTNTIPSFSHGSRRDASSSSVKSAAASTFTWDRCPELKLVDEIGGLADAIKALKVRLNLKPDLADLRVYPLETMADGALMYQRFLV